MQDFMFVFRQSRDLPMPTPEELAAVSPEWEHWMGSIAAQGKFTYGGRLTPSGKVLKPGGVVTDGPFVEVKELLGGYIVVKAADLEEATTLAHGCPILLRQGSVEIRPIDSRR